MSTVHEPLRITYRNPEFTIKEHNIIRKDLWHKFIIFDAAQYDKSLVLNSIITACEPDVLLPYMCKFENERNLTFITKCNQNAIKNLVMQGLRINILPNVEIYFDIVLGFLTPKEIKYNPQQLIGNLMRTRYNPLQKTLNLDAFKNDEGLQSLYCPVNLPRVLDAVLHIIKVRTINQGNNRDARMSIRKLSLQSNNINHVSFGEKFFATSLTVLDLRHNLLTDIIELKQFSEFKITEIWLDGNPLCTKYTKSEDYVNAVKSAFPHLQILDGVTVSIDKKYIPRIQPCYLANGSKVNLIKQFVTHFFTLYDQKDRIVMNGLYDDNALYSMTLGTISNHAHKQVTKNLTNNRNLLKFVDYSKCHEYLLIGPDKIISALRQQPQTTHNVRILQIDLLHYSNSHFVISVQGCFKYKDITTLPLYFCRTFVVTTKEENEYRIANDQYHISSAPNDMKEIKLDDKVPDFIPTILSVSERNQLIKFLHKLSNMNEVYCKKFLEETKWDIRLAISNFMKAYTVNNVPPEAFYNLY